MRSLYKLLLPILLVFASCGRDEIKEINLGFIAPLSTRATDLGVGPSNAMIMAVEEYNATKPLGAPNVHLFLEDDRWDKTMAEPAYNKLRTEHAIDVLFISNTDGTVALQDEIERDNVIAINPLNSDALLSSLNKNTFKIAKSTEAANELVAIRILELGLNKVLILHYPNDFMSRATNAVKDHLNLAGVDYKILQTGRDQSDFSKELLVAKEMGAEAIVFFGYKEYGYAMKQARKMGLKAQFFGSTVLMDPEYYDNSEGAISGTEFCFFTPADGNYFLAKEFLNRYERRFGGQPESIWPPMQAYDAMNMLLQKLSLVNEQKLDHGLHHWLRNQLHEIRYYQGVCGNLSITPDGSSRGIYFSMYQYDTKGMVNKIKR